MFLKASTGKGIYSQTALLTDNELRIPLPSRPEWIVVNAGGHGFYRIRYTPDLLSRLTPNLQENLSATERFNLVNDTWATAVAGLTPVTAYLDLLKLFGNETDHNVWTAILSSCHYLYRLLEPEQRPALQTFIRTLLGPITQRLGWSPQAGEHELISQLRGELLEALGTLARYAQYRQNRDAVDRNVVPALVSILAHIGGKAEYDEFYTNSKTAKTPQEEQRYLFALAAFRPADLFERTLAMTINGEVRTQNAPYLMRSLLLNTDGRERAWAFVKEHWEEMVRQYPDNSIPRMCEGIISLVTPALEADVRDFFAAHPVKQGSKTMEQHLEKLHIAVTCKQREATNLQAYLTRVA
jgi:puromycin-sensitive aminopeptidase